MAANGAVNGRDYRKDREEKQSRTDLPDRAECQVSKTVRVMGMSASFDVR